MTRVSASLLLAIAVCITVTLVGSTITPPRQPSVTPTASPSKSPYSDFCIANDYDPLPCLLSSIEFNLITSPLCFNGTVGGGGPGPGVTGEICIEFLSCGQVFISGLPSDYLQPRSLFVGAENLGFVCEGNLTVVRDQKHRAREFVGFASVIVNSTSFGIDVLVNESQPAYTYNATTTTSSDTSSSSSDSDGSSTVVTTGTGFYTVPTATTFTYCNLTSLYANVAFYQEPAGRVPRNPLSISSSTNFQTAIQNAVDSFLCVKLAQFFAVNVTDALVSVLDPALVEVVNSPIGVAPTFDDAR
jgi:hypothetical protein